MTKSRSRIALVALTGVVLAIGEVAGGSPAAGDEGPIVGLESLPGRMGVPTTDLAVQDYERVQPLLEHDRAHWGGAYASEGALTVVAVDQEVTDAKAALKEAGASPSLKVVTSSMSLARLDELADAVLRLGDDNVVSVGPDYRTGRVAVGLTEDSTATRRALAAIDQNLLYAMIVGAPAATSRFYDSSPFWGGAAIYRTGTGPSGYCSSGLSWHVPGQSRELMVTAGHCYRGSVEISGSRASYTTGNIHQILNSSPFFIQRAGVIWSSVTWGGTINGMSGDVAVYEYSTTSSVGKTYVGTGNTNTGRKILGTAVLPQGWEGDTLYTSGAAPYVGSGDGEVQLDWISQVNVTVYYGNTQQWMSGLDVGDNSWDCVTGGDSGGSVYKISGGSNAWGVGIISGSDGGGAGLSNCHNYFSPIAKVSSQFGGSIELG